MRLLPRAILSAALALMSIAAAAQPVTTLLNAVTATGAGSQFAFHNYPRTSFVCSETGTGTVTATVNVEVSQDGVTWFALATFSMSGTNASNSTTTAIEAYPYVRGNVTAISGTGAAITLNMYPP